jgi:pimeloyl-ACP methyl ester carboxylesterase
MFLTKFLHCVLAGSLGWAAMALSVAQTADAQEKRRPGTGINILLVHGAWADGSSWSKVIALLARRGFNVAATQNPLRTLEEDVTVTQQAIERLQKTNPGPVLLVGHSYGGTIITEAGSSPYVQGLVYVAAFAPDAGETTLGLAGQYPAPATDQLIVDSFGISVLSRQGIFEDFAQDLKQPEKEVIFSVQGPTALAALQTPVATAAWRSKPSWFVVAANDRAISPALEQMEASRMKANTITVPASHLAMLAEPEVVADFIASAAEACEREHR